MSGARVKNGKRPVIAFLGALPPPFGGFSISLQRLVERLEENGYDYTVYDLLNKRKVRSDGAATGIQSRLFWLLGYFFSAREDLICCHHIDWRLRAAVGLMTLLGRKTLISVGGQSLNDSLKKGGLLRRKVFVYSLRRYSFVIAHNAVIRDLCLSLGVKSDRLAIIPGFIPPAVRDEDFARIPREVRDFMESHTPVISAYAFKLVFYQGKDLYGLDMCVELCARLKEAHPRVGFVFCLPEVGDYDYFHKMQREIKNRNIEENFLFITQPLEEVYPIWKKSDIYVRPTASDGDALALREALYVRTPSVASDVVPRPEGSIIFKSRDIEDFVAHVKMVWDKYDHYKSKLESTDVGDGLDRTLAVYDRLVNEKRVRRDRADVSQPDSAGSA